MTIKETSTSSIRIDDEGDLKKFIKRLKERLISRICTPNKSVNTFEQARENERIIKEEIKELAGDKLR